MLAARHSCLGTRWRGRSARSCSGAHLLEALLAEVSSRPSAVVHVPGLVRCACTNGSLGACACSHAQSVFACSLQRHKASTLDICSSQAHPPRTNVPAGCLSSASCGTAARMAALRSPRLQESQPWWSPWRAAGAAKTCLKWAAAVALAVGQSRPATQALQKLRHSRCCRLARLLREQQKSAVALIGPHLGGH